MANDEHVKILSQGVEVWNKWRHDNPDTRPNLSRANLSFADFIGADLSHANLSFANLIYPNLSGADLSGADLSNAKLSDAKLSFASLRSADLSETNLRGANLRGANLRDANFSNARLNETNCSDTDLQNADFRNAIFLGTIFAYTDLSVARGLDSVRHYGPSEISISTLYRSAGSIPEAFLRGCGVPDDFITFIPSHFDLQQAIQFYSCFISYSTKNQDFAERLHTDLQAKHVRCWFAPEDLKIGDRFQERIEDSIRVYDKLLIILSGESISSRWVEREVNAAFEHEQKQNRTLLFPIRLDDTVMDCNQAWAADIRRSRHIGDFTGWKNHDSYQKAFARLMRDLKAESST
jgi:hypothetical protein